MRTPSLAVAAAVLAATLTVASAAAAHERERERDEEHEERRPERAGVAARSADPTYVKECGSCHLAYPPGLLPAASWRRIMAGLERHFGQNAELDPESRHAVEAWLARNAGPDRSRPGEPPLRITTLPWFVDEHDEVPQGAVARPSVRSMANCAACHPGAESWDFDDDRAKIPRS